MALPVLHIGDKNYSSWSMRPWLAFKHGGIEFEERQHALPDIGGKPSFGAISPNARLPALEIGVRAGHPIVISESLAICEWAAELAPHLWPEGPPGSIPRAIARGAAARMHSGFAALRNDCPMNIRRRADASRMTQAARDDAAQIDSMWSACLAISGGPYLFRTFGIVDAMYAPVVTRFVTYDIPRSAAAQKYIDTILADAHTAAWVTSAMKETRQLPRSDNA